MHFVLTDKGFFALQQLQAGTNGTGTALQLRMEWGNARARDRSRWDALAGLPPLLSQNIDWLDVTLRQVLSAVDKLNSRPRKCLNFQTPYEVFEKLTGVDVRKIMGYALIT